LIGKAFAYGNILSVHVVHLILIKSNRNKKVMTLEITQNNQALGNASNSIGTFVSNQIISKERLNKEGEIVGGNHIGEKFTFSNIKGLSNEMRAKIERDSSAYNNYHWQAFEEIESQTNGNLSPSNLGKLLNECESLKAMRSKKTEKLSVNYKNKLINGFYSAVNELEEIAIAFITKQMKEKDLVLTSFNYKFNGKSTIEIEKKRSVKESKGRVGSRTSSKQKKIDELEAQNARLMERLEALEAKS
jgi:hypothetical protein